MENTPSNVLSITLKRLNQKRNSMAKKPPKANPKTDLGKNPPPSGKIEKGRKAPSIAEMTIRKGLSGDDLKKQRGK